MGVRARAPHLCRTCVGIRAVLLTHLQVRIDTLGATRRHSGWRQDGILIPRVLV